MNRRGDSHSGRRLSTRGGRPDKWCATPNGRRPERLNRQRPPARSPETPPSTPVVVLEARVSAGFLLPRRGLAYCLRRSSILRRPLYLFAEHPRMIAFFSMPRSARPRTAYAVASTSAPPRASHPSIPRSEAQHAIRRRSKNAALSVGVDRGSEQAVNAPLSTILMASIS